ELSRGAWLGHVVVGAELEADDAVHVVAPGGEHDDRHPARLPDAAQRFDPVDARHHDVEHHDLVSAARREARGALAVLHRGHGKAFALEVLREHAGELDVVVCQENRRHGEMILSGYFAQRLFTQIYRLLTHLWTPRDETPGGRIGPPIRGRSMREHIKAFLLASSLAFGIPTFVEAEPLERASDGTHEMRAMRGLRELDLTEAQREQIFQILQHEAPVTRELMKRVHRAREALRRAESDMTLLRAETLGRVAAVLSPEQREKLALL